MNQNSLMFLPNAQMHEPNPHSKRWGFLELAPSRYKEECTTGFSAFFPHHLGQTADNEQEVFMQYLSHHVPIIMPGRVMTNKSCSWYWFSYLKEIKDKNIKVRKVSGESWHQNELGFIEHLQRNSGALVICITSKKRWGGWSPLVNAVLTLLCSLNPFRANRGMWFFHSQCLTCPDPSLNIGWVSHIPNAIPSHIMP